MIKEWLGWFKQCKEIKELEDENRVRNEDSSDTTSRGD